MSCTDDKFTITRGLDNTFVFTIKADGSTLPMELVGGEVLTAQLISLEDSTVVLTKPLIVEDALNGKVRLEVSNVEADSLSTSRGAKVDRYYLRPTYKLMLDCKNTSNGDFIAKVPEVYVD